MWKDVKGYEGLYTGKEMCYNDVADVVFVAHLIPAHFNYARS